MAVGDTARTSKEGGHHAISARFNGSTWTSVPTPGGTGLENVACVTSSFCIAVGENGASGVLLRWDGSRQPVVWTAPPPDMDPWQARLELARRYLHIFGPATPASFARWAGIGLAEGSAAFQGLASTLTPVRTPVNDAWILADDEAAFRSEPGPAAPARLLPSGDAYYLLWGADREILVPGAKRRAELWTTRVWPGAILVDGEIVGVWRRSAAEVSINLWRRLSSAEWEAVEAEAFSLPLPGPITIHGSVHAKGTAGRQRTA